MAPKNRGAVDAAGKPQPGETLAAASGRNVGNFLGRASKRRGNKSQAESAAASIGAALHHPLLPPLHRPPPQDAVACGAPAARAEAADPPSPRPLAAELPLEVAPAALGHGEEWEDVESEEEEEEEEEDQADAGPSHRSHNNLTITLHEPAGELGKAGRTASASKRRAYSKEDREVARLVHRAHLLCLLGRGLLYDSAADDGTLQAVLLSLVPPETAAKVVVSSSACTPDVLAALLDWFRQEFKLATSSVEQPPAGEEDEIAAAIARAQGVPAVVAQLLQAVDKRCGSAEELGALFGALLRVHGVPTRTVRLLEPSFLKPGDAERQQENAMKAFMKRPSRPTVVDLTTGEEAGPSKAAAIAPPSVPQQAAHAAMELISGEAARKKQFFMDELAASLGVSGSRANGASNGRGPAIRVDQRKLRRKAPAASPSAGKRPADYGMRAAEGPSNDAAAGASAPKKLRGKNAAGGVESDGKPSNKSKGAGQGRKRKSTAGPVPAAGDASGGGPTAAGDACSAAVPLDSVAASAPPSQRRRKGDDEYEQQLAVAMAATDFGGGQSTPAEQPCSPDPGSAAAKGGSARRGGARGAAFGRHQADVGRFWVEAYCGGAADGRWLHADPIAGWLDRAGEVEGLVPRGQALAYVVAFAGGGAKDVTRRYTTSFVAAEKQREGAWWDETLRPLRSRELAAVLSSNARQEELTPAGGKAAQASPPGSGRGGGNGASQSDLAAAREDRELAARAAAERLGLPTTIEGFRTHATFVLERHVGKYQALKPGSKPMGAHRGEPYYLREHMGEVHTVERWRRQGREVLPEELPCPAKRIKKRGVKDSGALPSPGGEGEAELLAEGEAEEELGGAAATMSLFYGEWQTGEWVPPAASNGKVPKNERGNVEVPPFAAALPQGTAHIRLPHVAAVCRKLGVDYAPALVGFDIRAGRPVPALEGVVVCVEHEAAVRAAYEEDLRQREARAAQKRREEAQSAWRVLLRSLLTRTQLQQAHGTGQAPQGAMAEAAAALLLGGNERAGAGGRRPGSAGDIGPTRSEQPQGSSDAQQQPDVLDGVKVEEI